MEGDLRKCKLHFLLGRGAGGIYCKLKVLGSSKRGLQNVTYHPPGIVRSKACFWILRDLQRILEMHGRGAGAGTAGGGGEEIVTYIFGGPPQM